METAAADAQAEPEAAQHVVEVDRVELALR